LTLGNVSSFLQVDGKVLALSGLAHDGISEGRVLELTQAFGKVAARTLVKFEAAPYARYAGPHSLLLATNKGVVRISFAGEDQWLARTDYEPLFPRSIVELKNGRIYVGMNRFVVELVPGATGYVERWYVPADCATFEVDWDKFECKCVPKR